MPASLRESHQPPKKHKEHGVYRMGVIAKPFILAICLGSVLTSACADVASDVSAAVANAASPEAAQARVIAIVSAAVGTAPDMAATITMTAIKALPAASAAIVSSAIAAAFCADAGRVAVAGVIAAPAFVGEIVSATAITCGTGESAKAVLAAVAGVAASTPAGLPAGGVPTTEQLSDAVFKAVFSNPAGAEAYYKAALAVAVSPPEQDAVKKAATLAYQAATHSTTLPPFASSN
jgi:hypothetical protein